MSLFDKAREFVNRTMQTEANEILGELKAACPVRSGAAQSALRVMGSGGGAIGTDARGVISNVFVGAPINWGDPDDGGVHLYYACYGNGGEGRIITAKHRHKKGGPGALGKYPKGIPGYGWRTSVHGYDGHDFIKDVAARHGG